VSLASHLHVAEESQAARDDFYPYYSNYFRLHAPKVNYAREVPRAVSSPARHRIRSGDMG
jgi:hypothetical protein